MKPFLKVGWVVGYVAYGVSVGLASNDVTKNAVRSQLVVIEASEGDEKIDKLGFLISDDGLILTSYSLLSDLRTRLGSVSKSFDPELVQYVAGPAEGYRPNTKFSPAVVVYSEDQRHSLLLLRAKELKRADYLELGPSFEGDKLFAAVYNKDKKLDEAQSDRGLLERNLWETPGFHLDEEQGGAPVYADGPGPADGGKIVGVLQDKTKSDDHNRVTPIEFAWPLLLPLNVFGQEKELGEIDRQFDLFISKPHIKDSPVTYRLCYRKLVPTKPTLKPTHAEIQYTIYDSKSNPLFSNKLSLPPSPPGPIADNCEGYFDVSAIQQRANSAKRSSPKGITVQIDATVTLSDNKTLPARHIFDEE
jgi:hypothetical protein